MNNDTNSAGPAQPSGGHPFAMVDTAVIDDEALHPHVKLVYVVLTRYASNVRTVWPARATIARKTGLSVRSVSNAIKAGADAGLWRIEHRLDAKRGNRQTSNLYHLRDLGNGYEPAGVQEVQGGPEQDMQGPVASGAHELDQRTRPVDIQTSSTSGDAGCGPLAAGEARPNSVQTTLKGKIDIWLPEGYEKMANNIAMKHLMKSAAGALKANGYVFDPDGRDTLTSGLRGTLDRGCSLEEVRTRLVVTLEQIGSDTTWGDLAYPVRTEERRAS